MCYDVSMNTQYYKIMGIDYGDVRIGIAMTDLSRTIASGYETYVRKSLEQDLQHLKQLIENNSVKKVVFGLPLNMDGTPGPRVQATYDFVQQLQSVIDIEVDYMDERLTSYEAEKFLISQDVSRKKRKSVLDKLSAVIILQNYLDQKER